MKIIIPSLAALIITLAMAFSPSLLVIDPDPKSGDEDTNPDIHYAAGMGCIDCHGSADMHGGFSLVKPNNTIHQPQSPDFIYGLESFLSTHTEEEAAMKNVDYQKVVAFLSK